MRGSRGDAGPSWCPPLTAGHRPFWCAVVQQWPTVHLLSAGWAWAGQRWSKRSRLWCRRLPQLVGLLYFTTALHLPLSARAIARPGDCGTTQGPLQVVTFGPSHG